MTTRECYVWSGGIPGHWFLWPHDESSLNILKRNHPQICIARTKIQRSCDWAV